MSGDIGIGFFVDVRVFIDFFMNPSWKYDSTLRSLSRWDSVLGVNLRLVSSVGSGVSNWGKSLKALLIRDVFLCVVCGSKIVFGSLIMSKRDWRSFFLRKVFDNRSIVEMKSLIRCLGILLGGLGSFDKS